MKRKWIRLSVGAGIGGLLGLGYYLLVGCSTGACPITSNPWISTGYGVLAGLLVTAGK